MALANAFALGCGEKLQTIILDENDIGAAGEEEHDEDNRSGRATQCDEHPLLLI